MIGSPDLAVFHPSMLVLKLAAAIKNYRTILQRSLRETPARWASCTKVEYVIRHSTRIYTPVRKIYRIEWR